MAWQDVADMVSDLGLKSDPQDIDGVRSEIRQRLKDLHPDTGPRTKDELDLYQKFITALDFLGTPDAARAQALVPVSAMNQLAVTLERALARVEAQNGQTANDRAEASYRSSRDRVRSRLRGPRISAATIAGAISLVFVFPDTASNSVYLKSLVENPLGRPLWLAVLAALGFLWLAASGYERRLLRRTQEMLSIDGQVAALREASSYGRFSRSALRHFLQAGGPPGMGSLSQRRPFENDRPPWRRLFEFAHPTPDLATVDEATNIAIQRFIDRHWVKETPANDFDDEYVVLIRPLG